MIKMLRRWLKGGRNNREPRPRSFQDTPEAWKEREVRPGETREEARARLEQYRK